MANTAKNAILRAKLAGVITDIMPKTVTDNVFVGEQTLTAFLNTLATKASVEELQTAINNLGALAGKDKVGQDDLDAALTALIATFATKAEVQAEATRATGEEARIEGLVTAETNRATGAEGALETRIETMEAFWAAAQADGTDTNVIDTLKEIQEYIANDETGASNMLAAIEALQAQLTGIDAGNGTVKKYVDDAIAALNVAQYAKAADLLAEAEKIATLQTTVGNHATAIAALQERDAQLGALANKSIVAEADLDADLKAKVNAAAEGNHSHDNKALLDTYDQTNADIKATVLAKHTHANKEVLDGITVDVVNAWNAKATIHYAETQPENMADGDLWVQLL